MRDTSAILELMPYSIILTLTLSSEHIIIISLKNVAFITPPRGASYTYTYTYRLVAKVLCTHLGHGGPKNESHCMIKFCISFVSQHHGDSGSIWAELNSSSFYCSDRVKVGYQLSVSRNHSYHSKIGLMA